MFGYDDALDCFGVHGVGGALGAILTGVFAVSEYGGNRGPPRRQCRPGASTSSRVSASSSLYDAIVSLIILWVVNAHRSACASPPTSSAKASTSPCTARPCSNQKTFRAFG